LIGGQQLGTKAMDNNSPPNYYRPQITIYNPVKALTLNNIENSGIDDSLVRELTGSMAVLVA
jgi:hypothetical protein